MNVIDQNTWPRKTLCDFFANEGLPYYEMTFDFDVTSFYHYIKREKLSFYFSVVYLSTQVINSIDAFLYKIRGDQIIKYDLLYAGSTDATQDGLFHYITIDNISDMRGYGEYARKVSREQKNLFGEYLCDQDQKIFYTCVPWVPFTSLSNIRPANKDNSIPHVTFGKYKKENNKILLPCSMMVNHRLIDGSHIGMYYENLQKAFNRYQ